MPDKKCKRCCAVKELEYCQDCFALENIKLHNMFKRKVRKKFGNRCQSCGKTREQTDFAKPRNPLTIHHLEPEGDRYDIDTVTLLCRECHNEAEKLLE